MTTDAIDDENNGSDEALHSENKSRGETEIANIDISSYRTPSVAITDALLETTGQSRGDLPPLYQYFDTEALDRLLKSIRNGQADPEGKLELQYADYRIRIHMEGSISIYER